MMMKTLCAILLVITTISAAPSILLGQLAPLHAERKGWRLVWSDEFNGTDGELPDASKWKMETGGGGWGNQELETYTDRAENVQQRGGNLVITVKRESYTAADGIAREYTSARLKTQGLFERRYGRFEARIKIPRGQGMWPAFWLLGTDVKTAGWSECGEIDIMENIGREPSTVHGTIHGPGYSADAGITAPFSLRGGKRFADDFHVYAVEWEPKRIRFYVDKHLYATRTPKSIPAGKKWVFDHDFFMILNVAVGGSWPGTPDDTTKFPQEMVVDYVRVYEKK